MFEEKNKIAMIRMTTPMVPQVHLVLLFFFFFSSSWRASIFLSVPAALFSALNFFSVDALISYNFLRNLYFYYKAYQSFPAAFIAR